MTKYQEPYKVTAVLPCGTPIHWTRNMWSSIKALYESLQEDRDNEGFQDIKLWALQADNTSWLEISAEELL